MLTEKIGFGKIGAVYKAEHTSRAEDIVAIKVIPNKRLKEGWQKEIDKVVKLKGIKNVVPYHTYGSGVDKEDNPFVWIAWDLIPGVDLKRYLSDARYPIDMAFIELLAITILRVLYSCKKVGVVHGDIHEGNILISSPDERVIGNPIEIYLADFGYGGPEGDQDAREDFRQLYTILKRLTDRVNPSDLSPRDKNMYYKFEEFLKNLHETNPTQGITIRSPEQLISQLNEFQKVAEVEAAMGGTVSDFSTAGDFPSTEMLGLRVEEWRALFVPEFLSPEKLLKRTTTVLTGARGCGKTMTFRRLTAFMDKLVDQPSGVKGADTFIGFYLNCRELVEPYTWIPKDLNEGAQQQLIHFFHLAWLSEITKTLALYSEQEPLDFSWFDKYLVLRFQEEYFRLPDGGLTINRIRAFLDEQKEKVRLTKLGKLKGLTHWQLARRDFLDEIQELLEKNIPWMRSKPMYLFLDDYTVPIVTPGIQRILNDIIFERKSNVVFKVSSESNRSFVRTTSKGKHLEVNHDFDLLDLASECLHHSEATRVAFLESVFRPRIKRHNRFQGENYTLLDILGGSKKSGNELATLMREKSKNKTKKRIYYHGADTFVNMWSSDIRIMIKILNLILTDAEEKLKNKAGKFAMPIKAHIQDAVFRSIGGELLESISSAQTPEYDLSQYNKKGNASLPIKSKMSSSPKPEEYGEALKSIVEAFTAISKYEMLKGHLVKNEEALVPKQAFRLEIIDKLELDNQARQLLDGLLRHHLFLQDWRGKSVRGFMTPRMYLNRALIPFSNLTFSSRDNIQLKSSQFQDLLLNPKKFVEDWKRKKGPPPGQLELFND
ncbi:MAG: protein kinase family protein [Anaerolineales bacterium]|nr:protein kinase family protein [Anaerolineales bacterium]